MDASLQEKTGLLPSPKDILSTCRYGTDWAYDVQACGGCLVRHRRATGSSAGVALHAPQGSSQQDLIAKAGSALGAQAEGTNWREGARELRSLGDVRHRNGANDTSEAAQHTAIGGIDATTSAECGRVVQAGGELTQTGELKKPALNGGGQDRPVTPANCRAISERMRK